MTVKVNRTSITEDVQGYFKNNEIHPPMVQEDELKWPKRIVES